MHDQVAFSEISSTSDLLIRVASNSQTTAVAGSIAKATREGKRPVLQAIGAGATNQALKALIVARSYLKEDGIDLIFVPTFADVTIEDQERTAVRLEVYPHKISV